MKPGDPHDPNEVENYTDDDYLDQDVTDTAADLDSYDDAGEIYDESDESWEDQDAAAPVKMKKKSSALSSIIIVIAMVIGAGILYMKFKPDTAPQADLGAPASESVVQSDQTLPSPQEAAAIADSAPPEVANIDPALTPPSETMPAPASSGSQGFMNDPDQLNQADLDKQADTTLPETQTMTGFDEPPAPEATETAQLPVPGAAPALPGIDSIKKAAPLEPAPAPLAAPEPVKPVETPTAVLPAAVEPVTAPAPADPTIAARETALMAKLDKVVERLDAVEKKVNEAPAASVPGSSNGELASLRVALERLENKVDKLGNEPAPVRQMSGNSYDSEITVDKPIIRKAPVVKKKRKASASTSSASTASVSSGKWELRSARPGEAMVSRSGQADLKTVRVGDSVVGIGQITSISQVGGAWVVQGTGGSIAQ